MAKVYEFPVKVLPEEMEKYFYELGREYGEKVFYALDIFTDKYRLDISKEEITEMLIMSYANGIIDIMDEM